MPEHNNNTRRQILISINESADALRVGRTKIYELISNGDLITVKIGSRRLVTMESIEALVEKHIRGAA